MSDVYDQLEESWARTEEATRREFADAIELVETAIDLMRSAFSTIQGHDTADDRTRLIVALSNQIETSLEAAYALVLKGYYQPAAACARMMLEAFAYVLDSFAHPLHAKRALEEPAFRIAIKDGLNAQEDQGSKQWMLEAYDELSAITHPRSRSLGVGRTASTGLRISSFASNHALTTFNFLIHLSRLAVQLQQPVIQDLGTNPAWLALYDKHAMAFLKWVDAQKSDGTS